MAKDLVHGWGHPGNGQPPLTAADRELLEAAERETHRVIEDSCQYDEALDELERAECGLED